MSERVRLARKVGQGRTLSNADRGQIRQILLCGEREPDAWVMADHLDMFRRGCGRTLTVWRGPAENHWGPVVPVLFGASAGSSTETPRRYNARHLEMMDLHAAGHHEGEPDEDCSTCNTDNFDFDAVIRWIDREIASATDEARRRKDSPFYRGKAFALERVRLRVLRAMGRDIFAPPEHVCGMSGFGTAYDDVCPACEMRAQQRAPGSE